MIKNYLTVALRNIRKQKFYAWLNVLGLSIGIAASLLITLYVVDELSYDQFHSRSEDIYRVGLTGKLAGQEINVAVSCPPFAKVSVAEFPEVEKAIRLYRLESEVTRYEEIVFTETEVFFADSNFFDVFDGYALLEGDPATALREPNTLVMTEGTARKYFGDESAMGKIVTVGDYNSAYEVTGIVQDPPENAHFHFDLLYAMSTFEYSKRDQWLSNNFYTYLMLNEEASSEALEAKFPTLVEKYVGPEVEQFMGISLEEFQAQGDGQNAYGYFLQPLTDIHLYSQLDAEIEANSNITYVYILIAVAVFILLIACINFMNLSTARSANRAKEVGVRKTLGSLRQDLVGQFLAESILVSLIAALISVVLLAVFIDPFNQLAGKAIELGVAKQPWLLLVLIGIVLLVGLVAGSYPAFYLSSFRPAEVLKGKLKAGLRSSGIRNGLVVFQFVVSISLIVCTLLVYQQLEYTQNKNLGFDKENVLVVNNMRRLEDKAETFKKSLLQKSSVVNATLANDLPPAIQNSSVFRVQGEEQDHIITFYFTDANHLPTMGIELKEGRNFLEDNPADSAAIILNEAAVREFGLDDPLEAKITGQFGPQPQVLRVVGVTQDFNFQSLRNKIRPMAIMMTRQGSQHLAVRLQPGDVATTLADIEQSWQELSPGEPFEYSFLDQDFDQLFRAEQRLGQVFTVFTGLAIFIACLGLLGLAAYTAEQRTKEIGIRKVMGASVTRMVLLLSQDFAKLVGVAFLIAVPLSYFLMQQWLSDFAYRINIGVGTFVLAGVAALAVAWITVSFQSLRAARTNPAKSLRSE